MMSLRILHLCCEILKHWRREGRDRKRKRFLSSASLKIDRGPPRSNRRIAAGLSIGEALVFGLGASGLGNYEDNLPVEVLLIRILFSKIGLRSGQ